MTLPRAFRSPSPWSGVTVTSAPSFTLASSEVGTESSIQTVERSATVYTSAGSPSLPTAVPTSTLRSTIRPASGERSSYWRSVEALGVASSRFWAAATSAAFRPSAESFCRARSTRNWFSWNTALALSYAA